MGYKANAFTRCILILTKCLQTISKYRTDIIYLLGILSLPYLCVKYFRANKIFKYEAKHQNKG